MREEYENGVSIAQIWKKYYNKMHGKGTIEKAVSKSIALK